MEQNMETNKQNKTDRIIATTVLVICLVSLGLFLVGCNQTKITPVAPDETGVAASIPHDSTTPTATLTQSEKAAEVAAQQFVPDYFPNKDACHEAVAGGMVTECMYAGSVQSVTRPEWEQLFPNAEFYLIRLDAYHPENEYSDFSSRYKLLAWQNEKQYDAKLFDQFLKANGIAITEENYELISQAFALMTLKEFITEDIIFTHWELISLPNGDEHYDARLEAWAKLGGLGSVDICMRFA